MSGNSLNYYGYDKYTYRACLSHIHSTNKKHIFILNTWFLLVNMLYLVFSMLNLWGLTQERAPFYAVYLGLALAFDVFLLIFSHFSERHSFILVYISMAMMLSYGILVSVAQPYMPATLFMLLLALNAIVYIHQAFAMSAVIVGVSALFVFTSFHFKTFSIAYNDTYNALIVATLAIGLHVMLQRTKISQFVSYQKEQLIQQELEVKASFDALTSLLNRSRFFSLAEQVMRSSKDEYTAVCLIDLDGFKQINDQMGHQMGDKAIQITGNTIIETLEMDLSERWKFIDMVQDSGGSFAGRLGGDEFIAFIRGKHSQEEIKELLQILLDTLNGIKIDKLEGIHASLGVTQIFSSDNDLDKVYARADAALYVSKKQGKNRICFSTATEV